MRRQKTKSLMHLSSFQVMSARIKASSRYQGFPEEFVSLRRLIDKRYICIPQILYERGKFVPGMQGRQDEKTKEKLIMNGMSHKIRPDNLNAHAVLGACPDFHFERTALQNVVEKRGHILLPSVVCTPETAGGGIEYAWGKLKYEQRQQNDSAVKLEAGAKFIARVRSLCQDKSILPLSRVWKYERRARDYIMFRI